MASNYYVTRTEDTYRKHWDYYFKLYGRYMDLEKRLAWEMKPFEGETGITEESRTVIKKMYAQKIADEAKKELLEQKKLVVRVNTGKANLGFTTWQQEISEKHSIITKFEFCCLLLADFKRKYNLA